MTSNQIEQQDDQCVNVIIEFPGGRKFAKAYPIKLLKENSSFVSAAATSVRRCIRDNIDPK